MYKRTGEQEDLEQVIRISQNVVNRLPASSSSLPTHLNNLATILHERFVLTKEVGDLEQAIEMLQRAVKLTPLNSPGRSVRANNLASYLLDRYAQNGKVEDLEQSIATLQDMLPNLHRSDSELPRIYSNLGNSLRARYGLTGQLEDLYQAINALQTAVTATAAGSPDYPGYLNNLGSALSVFYTQTGQPEALERAIQACQTAVACTPSHSPQKPIHLNGLAAVLIEYYYHQGRQEDLEQAIIALQQALEIQVTDSLHRSTTLSNLGGALSTRFSLLGKIEDLELSLGYYREAFQSTSTDSPDFSIRLENLGSSLSEYYEHTGQLEVLEQAIEVLQTAVDRMSAAAPNYPIALSNLGSSLLKRYNHLGRLEDLEWAIRICQDALLHNVASTSSPHALLIRSTLATALSLRYARTKQFKDLEWAIQSFRDIVKLASYDSPRLPEFLTSLGNNLRTRYHRTGEIKDLEQAIEAFRDAFQHVSHHTTHLPNILNSLGNGMHDLYKNTGEIKDLGQAIEAFRDAFQYLPSTSPDTTAIHANLGDALTSLYKLTGNNDHLELARISYEEACQKGIQFAPEAALYVSRSWGSWAMERRDWHEAVQAFDYGVSAIEQIYRIQLTRKSQEMWLTEVYGLHARAAYVTARTGRLREATVIIEQGRARELSNTLARDQANLEQIRRETPDVYEQYQQAAERLRWLERSSRKRSVSSQETLKEAELDLPREQILQSREDLEHAILRIRQIPGYERFLAAPAYSDIVEATRSDMPLVYMVITELGGLALIVRTAYDAPEAVWLDSFTENDLTDLLVKRSGKVDNATIGGYVAGQLLSTAWLSTALDEALPLLGSEYVAPIAEQLYKKEISGVTLIPTGLLGLLPLHAATYEKEGKETCLLNEFNVAYTPSARVLMIVQREAQKRRSNDMKFVGIVNPLLEKEVAILAQGKLQSIVPPLREAITARRSQLEARFPTFQLEEKDQIQKLINLWEETFLRLHQLCQIPSEELLYAGETFRRAAGIFGEFPTLNEEVVETLMQIAARIPPSLAYAQFELESIQKLLPVENVVALYGEDATREALWEALIETTHVHFACHGTFDPESPLDSALLLARDSRLSLRDLLNVEGQHLSNLFMVVLSACQTAMIDFQRIPDEVVGFLSGFLQAGVPSVVGTLWSIDDLSTSLLMRRFYELYLRGDEQLRLSPQPPVHALRLAQCWLRDLTYNDLLEYLKVHQNRALPLVRKAVRDGKGNEHPYADPYYWAAFVYYGAL